MELLLGEHLPGQHVDACTMMLIMRMVQMMLMMMTMSISMEMVGDFDDGDAGCDVDRKAW